jgi:hypothetical protein
MNVAVWFSNSGFVTDDRYDQLRMIGYRPRARTELVIGGPPQTLGKGRTQVTTRQTLPKRASGAFAPLPTGLGHAGESPDSS